MKIISKFHDYYDSALAYGHDDNVVYKRDTMKFKYRTTEIDKVPQKIKELHKIISIKNDHYWYGGLPSNASNKKYNLEFTAITIVFCGKLYKGVRVETGKNTAVGFKTDTSYFYNYDSMIEYMSNLGFNKSSKADYRNKTLFTSLESYFNDVKTLDVDWLIENKLSIAVLLTDSYNHKLLCINPQLKDYQFYKAVDAYTAYQELDMWISGTLAWPQNFMVEIEDKYKIEGHGFDPKYGFRTRPKEKTK